LAGHCLGGLPVGSKQAVDLTRLKKIKKTPVIFDGSDFPRGHPSTLLFEFIGFYAHLERGRSLPVEDFLGYNTVRG
jgi:hypothetical protein